MRPDCTEGMGPVGTNGPEQPAPPSRKDCFPGTASMFASERRMAVTTEWMRGWNACLDEIDRRGGFDNG